MTNLLWKEEKRKAKQGNEKRAKTFQECPRFFKALQYMPSNALTATHPFVLPCVYIVPFPSAAAAGCIKYVNS